MIQCHTFNSFTRLDLRQNSVYVFTQFVGGMAAPLFLFMAGMTTGFQMEGRAWRESAPLDRWLAVLRRAGYLFFLAYAFRATNWIASLPHPTLQELTKVDILNCMALAAAFFSLIALLDDTQRLRFTVIAALGVALAAPIVSNVHWEGAPAILRDYLVPSPEKGRFPFFPCGAYLGFGLAAGAIVKRGAAKSMHRLMQWAVLLGLCLIFSAEYFANLPYSVYAASDFWRNSPALIFIRVGIILLILGASYVLTELIPWRGWNWLENLGKTSLMVYWVHVMLVYGDIMKVLKRALTVPEAALATVGVTLLMVALTEIRLRHRERRLARWKAATTVAGVAEA